MYKCLLKNDMNVVTGNFRNNRQNVKVSRAKKILLKKKVLLCCVRKPFYTVNMKYFCFATLCFSYPNESTLTLQCKIRLRLYINK